MNTTSPGLKRHLAEDASAHGVEVVDVALTATVPGRGLATEDSLRELDLSP